MSFADLAAGSAPFLDANIFVYHVSLHPQWGAACSELLERIERQELQGFTSTHVVSEAAHRLLTLEAMSLPGAPKTGLVRYLQRHSAQLQQLVRFEQAIADVLTSSIRILVIPPQLLNAANAISRQFGLLHNDALIIALMQANGLTALASHDDDFYRVPGITRYGPA